MLDFIVKGGAVLWLIMALSVVACTIIIERFLYFRRINVDEDKLYTRVKASLTEGRFNEAIAICEQNLSPFAGMMKAGIENRFYPENVQREMLKDAAAQEAPHLEHNISFLGTVTTISPLLGLLGTVTGVMKAFGVLGKFGAVSDPSALANGVAEALITTVGGIVVAVPVTICYNLLISKANNTLTKLETQVSSLILVINSNPNENDGGPQK